MFVQILKSKIHRAVVTEANLNYIGSITIDAELMDKAGILPNEKVYIVNNNNGADTADRKSGTVLHRYRK